MLNTRYQPEAVDPIMSDFIQSSRLSNPRDPIFDDFQGFMEYIRRPTVQQGFKKALTAIYTVATAKSSRALTEEQENTKIQKFIVSHVIKNFPTNVIQSPVYPPEAQSLEGRLIRAASDMVDNIQTWVVSWKEHGSFEAIDSEAAVTLIESISTYITLFIEWEAKDKPILIDKIKRALTSTVAALEMSVPFVQRGEANLSEVAATQVAFKYLSEKLSSLIGHEAAQDFIRGLPSV